MRTAGPVSWAPQAGRRCENPHIPTVRDGFNFCLFMCWLLYGFKPWSSWQGDQQCVCPLHSSHPTVPTFWGEGVAGTGPACPDQMRCSGEALTVVREKGPNLNLSLRKDEQVRFETERIISVKKEASPPHTLLAYCAFYPVCHPSLCPSCQIPYWVHSVRKGGPKIFACQERGSQPSRAQGQGAQAVSDFSRSFPPNGSSLHWNTTVWL